MIYAIGSVGLLVGLLFIGTAIPLLRRSVRPNHLYGLRSDETLENEEVWYEANYRSANDLVKVGIANIIVSTGLYLIPGLNTENHAMVCCGFLIVSVLWYCVRGNRIAKQVKAEVDRRAKLEFFDGES